MGLDFFVKIFESIPAMATIAPIILCSVLLLGVFIERMVFYRNIRYDYKVFTSEMVKCIAENRLAEGMSYCSGFNGPIAKMFADITGDWNSASDRSAMMNYHASRAMRSIEKYAAMISTISTVAPMLGLFGTVAGMMKSFGGLAGGGRESIALGITEALITTILGLFVAIPAVVFYNYMVSKSSGYAEEIEHALNNLSGIQSAAKTRKAASK